MSSGLKTSTPGAIVVSEIGQSPNAISLHIVFWNRLLLMDKIGLLVRHFRAVAIQIRENITLV